jgi:hypothetical protein
MSDHENVGSDADYGRCLAVLVGALIFVVLYVVCAGAVVALKGLRGAKVTVAMALAASTLAGLGGPLQSVWKHLADGLSNAFHRNDWTPATRGPSARTRLSLLLIALGFLGVALIISILDSGGITASPFVQYFLLYFVSGILMARKPKMRWMILALATASPFFVVGLEQIDQLHVINRSMVNHLETPFRALSFAVMTSIATLVGAIVNWLSSVDGNGEILPGSVANIQPGVVKED